MGVMTDEVGQTISMIVVNNQLPEVISKFFQVYLWW